MESKIFDIVIGVLLGNEDNGKLQVFNSFEFVIIDNSPDLTSLQTRLEQQSVILPNEYIIGVYQITQNKDLKPDDNIILLHSLLEGYNNNLITLIFNPNFAAKKHTNEKFIKIFDNKQNELKFDVDNKEAEKIAVDTVLEIKENDSNDESQKANDQLISQSFLLKTIKNKIRLIIAFLQQADPEKTPNYYDILRNVNSFISKIQYKQDEDIKTKLVDLETEYNTLISIGTITENIKNLESISLDLKKYDSA
ncbi:COP9 signalosome complex subunit 6 [Wickerhamomyces ciferrii]|uniref:COP9 signalosome complex subunit 6 n=1 Tax=Wickerhamomyces ciferrii (strain ATCC 14091 / BCRC 22168 / CBS 111 / JCM 3599 / NBRC 0793 / NRRL Y-1031 F-60-10) TaxID=1206466 RepID=K0KLV8_WICCF|nr:COP9 signalosome complex subunit 6 [Wickerhamomyces ciferrii]CCH43192.1 COP9 signalosome complex subunit 6 [Wickerhamomyces ciferrii]